MKTLYLDTSYNQVLGLLGPGGTWLGRRVLPGQRGSATLHGALHAMCEECGTAPSDIKEVLYSAGPGFYTGLRIGFGIARMIGLGGAVLRGFHAHEIPALLGLGDYTWVTKAYRGEVFVHRRAEGAAASTLYAEADFLALPLGGKVFIHHPSALDEVTSAKLVGAGLTEELLEKGMPRIVHELRGRGELPLHYFRPPEDEFRPNP